MKIINPKKRTNNYFDDAEPGDIIQKTLMDRLFILL